MAQRCLLYYITDRKAFPGDESARRRSLLDKIAEAAHFGVDFIQLREKDLSARELEGLAREVVDVVARSSQAAQRAEPGTRLLINSRVDVAFATGAHGVHLRGDDISPANVHAVLDACVSPAVDRRIFSPIVAVSCHSAEEVTRAAEQKADLAVFAPVFEKKDSPENLPIGLDALRATTRAGIPVLALGGVTLSNAESCLRAGASGIAAIRLFQENEIATVIRQLQPA